MLDYGGTLVSGSEKTENVQVGRWVRTRVYYRLLLVYAVVDHVITPHTNQRTPHSTTPCPTSSPRGRAPARRSSPRSRTSAGTSRCVLLACLPACFFDSCVVVYVRVSLSMSVLCVCVGGSVSWLDMCMCVRPPRPSTNPFLLSISTPPQQNKIPQQNSVFVVTGMERQALEAGFGAVGNLGLGAEHGTSGRPELHFGLPTYTHNPQPPNKHRQHAGFFFKMPHAHLSAPAAPTATAASASPTPGGSGGGWEMMLPSFDSAWMQLARAIMDVYVKRTHGTYIEQKGSALLWQYRDADPEFGHMQSKELEVRCFVLGLGGGQVPIGSFVGSSKTSSPLHLPSSYPQPSTPPPKISLKPTTGPPLRRAAGLPRGDPPRGEQPHAGACVRACAFWGWWMATWMDGWIDGWMDG